MLSALEAQSPALVVILPDWWRDTENDRRGLLLHGAAIGMYACNIEAADELVFLRDLSRVEL